MREYREYIDALSDWMQTQEKIEPGLPEEFYQLALETDSLLQASEQLQSAYSSLLGKVEHVSS